MTLMTMAAMTMTTTTEHAIIPPCTPLLGGVLSLHAAAGWGSLDLRLLSITPDPPSNVFIVPIRNSYTLLILKLVYKQMVGMPPPPPPPLPPPDGDWGGSGPNKG